MAAGGIGDHLGQGGLPGSGRPVEDQGRDLVRLDEPAEQQAFKGIQKYRLLPRLLLVGLLFLMCASCGGLLAPKFPSELQGRWNNNSLTYYTEWYGFSGSTMEWYNSYYSVDKTYDLKDIDTKAKHFTVTRGSSSYGWIYSVSGSTLTLQGDGGGKVWTLQH
jgi:hypothetical protein